MSDEWSDSWETRPLGDRTVFSLPACTLRTSNGQPLRFHSSTIRIGSAPDNDLVLPGETVSRHHAELFLAGNGPRLLDLDSTNGTFVDGVKIREVWLHPDAVITFGDTVIAFTADTEVVQIQPATTDRLGNLVGTSSTMRQMFNLIEAVARTDATLLLQGETGTGKEVVARTVHERSMRCEQPFVIVDCGSLPPNLLESELFGHEKGSFSGALSGRVGLFESADGGTVFLDEIGELPLELQPKLLRVLETGEVRRVGSNRPVRLNIRVVAATNRNLAKEAKDGRFRQDLYYRLNVVPVHIPPLRERREDIPLLVEHLLATGSFNDDGKGGRRLGRLPGHWEQALASHSFMGNVRELINLVERAVAIPDVPPTLSTPQAEEFPTDGQKRISRGTDRSNDIPLFRVEKERLVNDFEYNYLATLLQQSGGNLSQAARIAGLDRKHLRDLVRKHGLYEKA